MQVVTDKKTFRFKNLCPYCGGTLTYTVTGWTKSHPAKSYWKAENIESDCSNEPEIWNSEEWEEWLQQHSEMPYVHQLPVDMQILNYINKHYRFNLDFNS